MCETNMVLIQNKHDSCKMFLLGTVGEPEQTLQHASKMYHRTMKMPADLQAVADRKFLPEFGHLLSTNKFPSFVVFYQGTTIHEERAFKNAWSYLKHGVHGDRPPKVMVKWAMQCATTLLLFYGDLWLIPCCSLLSPRRALLTI